MHARRISMAALGLVAGALLAGNSPILAAEDMAVKNQITKNFAFKSVEKSELHYLLYLPDGYSAKNSGPWPLMLFLHGAGERGTNIAKVTVHGPPKLVKSGQQFPFILVSPQCPAGQTWDDEALLALIDNVSRQYRVDEKRIYLTGLSMGGFATWSLISSHPERFAAAAPICGGGSILPMLLPSRTAAAGIKRLPVWAFHGAKDDVVRLEESERMVNAFRAAGNEVKLTVYPEAGHDSWTATYDNPDLYDWFMQQRRR